MKNLFKDGKQIMLPLTGKSSGGAVVLGEHVGTAMNDTELDAEGNPIGTVCLVDESIVTHNVTENQGGSISNGDKVYINPADDLLSNDPAHTFFGVAYSPDTAGELIGTGASAEIQIRQRGVS